MSFYLVYHTKCSSWYQPATQERLLPDEANQGKYKYQDLITAPCPLCSTTVYNWVGVDDIGMATYHSLISPKQHAYWDLRRLLYKVRDVKKDFADKVQSSRHVAPWDLREVPVY